jgi:hypothetical protein
LEFDKDPEIESVVDFEIFSEDGSVVLLYGDGRMRRYARGLILWDESDVAANGLEAPMISPTAIKIAGSGLNSSIFVSDPGTGRILQFSLGGTYLAQFRALDESGGELFSQTTDFVVTDNPLRIFSVANNRVYVATLE